MLPLSKPFPFVGTTAFGQTHEQTRQYFEVEIQDQYEPLPHWMGFHHQAKLFRKHEVGSIVCKHWDTKGWITWSFANKCKSDLMDELQDKGLLYE